MSVRFVTSNLAGQLQYHKKTFIRTSHKPCYKMEAKAEIQSYSAGSDNVVEYLQATESSLTA